MQGRQGKESSIERECVRICMNQGFYTFKLRSPSHSGVPDRVFMKDGRVLFVEFKTPEGRVRPAQQLVFNSMAQHGVQVPIIRSVEDFIGLLRQF